MKLVIRDNTLIAVTRRRKGDREPDWPTAPLAEVRVSPDALAEILRLHAARFDGGRRADLRGADLRGANLQGAYLQGANLQGAYLPAPTMILLATWGVLSAALTVEAMRLDAACHPDPEAFGRWAAGGSCPYSGVHVQMAVSFSERRDLWSPGPCPRPYDLMLGILAEKCPDWPAEKIAEFEVQFQGRIQPAEVTSSSTARTSGRPPIPRPHPHASIGPA